MTPERRAYLDHLYMTPKRRGYLDHLAALGYLDYLKSSLVKTEAIRPATGTAVTGAASNTKTQTVIPSSGKEVRMHVLFERVERIEQKLDRLIAMQFTNKQETEAMALDITALQQAVQNETTVDQSVMTLVTTLAAQIQALIASSGNTVDPAALQAIVDQMKTNATMPLRRGSLSRGSK